MVPLSGWEVGGQGSMRRVGEVLIGSGPNSGDLEEAGLHSL